MATVKIHKTTALPGTLEGHAVYLVAPASKPNYVEMYVTSADPTIDSGAASYVWRAATSEWIKLTEYESMDLSITWAMIQGKPTSSPSAIDAAVANSHSHANMTQLNKVGEDANGDFTYNVNPPRARLETAGW